MSRKHSSRSCRLRRQSYRVQIRGEPAPRGVNRPTLALRVVGELVLADLADAEIGRLRMGEVQAGDRRAGPDRVAVRERDVDALLGAEQVPERALLGVIGLGWVTGRWADTAITLGDEVFV